MAIDETQKRQAKAADFMAAIGDLADALERAGSLASSINAASLSFIDSDFEIDGLRHMDATLFASGLTQLDYSQNSSVIKYMIDNGIQTIFDRIRP